MFDEILALAMTLGHLETSEELSALCQGVESELTGLLREDVKKEDCAGAFALAGAWMALAALEVGGDAVDKFSAGDVSVERGDRQARSAALRLQASQVMRPYLRDDFFAFRGVRG